MASKVTDCAYAPEPLLKEAQNELSNNHVNGSEVVIRNVTPPKEPDEADATQIVEKGEEKDLSCPPQAIDLQFRNRNDLDSAPSSGHRNDHMNGPAAIPNGTPAPVQPNMINADATSKNADSNTTESQNREVPPWENTMRGITRNKKKFEVRANRVYIGGYSSVEEAICARNAAFEYAFSEEYNQATPEEQKNAAKGAARIACQHFHSLDEVVQDRTRTNSDARLSDAPARKVPSRPKKGNAAKSQSIAGLRKRSSGKWEVMPKNIYIGVYSSREEAICAWTAANQYITDKGRNKLGAKGAADRALRDWRERKDDQVDKATAATVGSSKMNFNKVGLASTPRRSPSPSEEYKDANDMPNAVDAETLDTKAPNNANVDVASSTKEMSSNVDRDKQESLGSPRVTGKAPVKPYVHEQKNAKRKWRAMVTQMYIGSYHSKEEAHCAAVAAADCLNSPEYTQAGNAGRKKAGTEAAIKALVNFDKSRGLNDTETSRRKHHQSPARKRSVDKVIDVSTKRRRISKFKGICYNREKKMWEVKVDEHFITYCRSKNEALRAQAAATKQLYDFDQDAKEAATQGFDREAERQVTDDENKKGGSGCAGVQNDSPKDVLMRPRTNHSDLALNTTANQPSTLASTATAASIDPSDKVTYNVSASFAHKQNNILSVDDAAHAPPALNAANAILADKGHAEGIQLSIGDRLAEAIRAATEAVEEFRNTQQRDELQPRRRRLRHSTQPAKAPTAAENQPEDEVASLKSYEPLGTSEVTDWTDYATGLIEAPKSDFYCEESAWRFHNAKPQNEMEGREDEALKSLPPPPSLPEFPNTDCCIWSWDEESRVLLARFQEDQNGTVRIDEQDEVFLLEMMERDDLTVISDGLANEMDPDLWTPDYMERRVGTEYFHRFRQFRKRVVKDTNAAQRNVDNVDGDAGACSSAKYDEVDKCFSMKISDYFEYLRARGRALDDLVRRQTETNSTTLPPDSSMCETTLLNDAPNTKGAVFVFTDDKGKEHVIDDVLDVVLYMIDFDIVKLLPTLHGDLKRAFKLPGCLPGGIHCMMNEVNPGGRPFMGPNLYVTPPSSFTYFHQDGHGTVDSGHLCLSGFNEVVMLRRMTEIHKKNALSLLYGKGTVDQKTQYDGLYGEPHSDGMGEKPKWPDRRAIEDCRRMGYCPSVFVLRPGQLVHINKGRLHAFRKLSAEKLHQEDCHQFLRSQIQQAQGAAVIEASPCVSVAWDWMYRGFTRRGINREATTILECAALNRLHERQSLAIPELAIVQMAKALTSQVKSGNRWLPPTTRFRGRSVKPSTETVLAGILPSLRFIVSEHEAAERGAEARKTRSTTNRVSIARKPDSWENPEIFPMDPYGNGDFFCKLCHKELSNVYMHCDGCEKILNKDFNICISCHAEGRYRRLIKMHPLNEKRHCTVNHTGNMRHSRRSRCPCKNGPACKNCGYCSGCSCRCHRWFTLRHRFYALEDEKLLLKDVEAIVGEFSDEETLARLRWIGSWTKQALEAKQATNCSVLAGGLIDVQQNGGEVGALQPDAGASHSGAPQCIACPPSLGPQKDQEETDK